MTDIQVTIEYLRGKGIESFEGPGILIIPCDNPEEIYDLATRCKRYFKEIGFEKSWQVDPYYYQRKRHSDGTVVTGPEG